MMRLRRLLPLPAAGLLVVVFVAPTAIAQDPGQVVHRQSVLTELTATGEAGASRVFTQLTIPSSVTEVVLPNQSTRGLRGLSGPSSATDAGELRFSGSGDTARTVADHTAALPVSVAIRHELDGQAIEPGRLRGRSGQVSVTYVVANLTAEPTELTLVDGDGRTRTEKVSVAVPFVGSLSMTLPSGYTEVEAPGAVVVGDGRGGTVVNWTLLLFAPLGSEVQEVTWTARASGAVLPEASLQILPVTPSSFGSLASTENAYDGAVTSTSELTAGAREIDSNLLRLAEGASTLLAGLVQLRDGASELSSGLVTATTGAGDLSDGLDQARTGASLLSTGLGELRAGSSELSAGLTTARTGGSELADGLITLADGTTALSTGAGTLADGAGEVDAGAAALAAGAGELAGGAAEVLAGLELLSAGITGTDGLPAAIAGIEALASGIGSATAAGTLLNGLALLDGGLVQAQAGIGAPGIPDTLRDGVAQVDGGLAALDVGLQELAFGISNPGCAPADPLNPCGIREGAAGIEAGATGLIASLAGVAGLLQSIDATPLSPADQVSLATAIGGIGDVTTEATILNGIAVVQATAGALVGGTDQLLAGIGSPEAVGTLRNGISQLETGAGLLEDGLVLLSDSIGSPAAADTLRNGVARITAGVSNPSALATNPTCDPTVTPGNPCGLLQGLQVLGAGLTEALAQTAAGLGTTDTTGSLLWGADQVAGGAGEVADGAGQLQQDGTAALVVGAEQLEAGSLQLDAGAAEAAAGGASLRDGLVQLDDGGARLAAGATDAAVGGSQLLNGIERLDDGAGRLASGLVDARDGSERLADGLGDAADGGTQVVDGSEQLSTEGTSVLADSVSDATLSSSLQLEQVRAVAARGIAGDGLPYPTVDGADATAVYQFSIAGVGDVAGPATAGRIALGLLLLAAVIALMVARRPRVIVLPEVEATQRTHAEA